MAGRVSDAAANLIGHPDSGGGLHSADLRQLQGFQLLAKPRAGCFRHQIRARMRDHDYELARSSLDDPGALKKTSPCGTRKPN